MIMDDFEISYNYSEIEEIILNYKSRDAVKLLVSLLKNDKDEIEKIFEKAMIYYYIDSDLKNTLKELDKLLEINPSHVDALLLKGQILAGIHRHNKAIETLNNIHPKILPYGYKKLIEFITEYNHSRTDYYCVFDFDLQFQYVYVESDSFKRLGDCSIRYLEEYILGSGLIWQYLDSNLYEIVPLISGSRLSDEEPTIEANPVGDSQNCIICGRKLKSNEKNFCKSCLKKQYASKIIKKLVSVVQPEISFKKNDLNTLNLDDIQIKDYIWTLQEFDLIDVDNNKFKLKDKNTLNDFRIESHMEPIDFDSLEEENKLNNTCKICGKTLPISQFYKSSEGYGDTCKICKKLMVTARYLEDIIKCVGFDKEFDVDELTEYIPNENQIMGMIWSLQDNDLLIGKGSETYILVDKSKCLEFLDKYDPNYEFHETDIKSKVKVNGKSKVDEGLSKSKIKESVTVSVKSKKDSNLVSEQKEQMKIVLKARKEGKSREEAADIAGIPYYKINHWYKEGKQGFGKDNVYFYKQLKKIENNLSDSLDLNERKQMNFVLKLLRQGKSKEEIAKLTELNASTIAAWYNQGKEKYSRNTIYFYNEVQKINEINEEKTKVKNLKIQLKEFIPKFISLDEKIAELNVNNSELKSISNDIKSNIEILKSSSKLRRTDKLENRLLNAEKSYKELNNRFNVELANINNTKEDSNKQDLLEFLYSITGSNDITLKVSFIHDLAFKHLSVKEGKEIREKIKNEINEDVLKTSDDIQLRLDELIKEKQVDGTDDLLEFLYSLTGRYNINSSFWTEFSVENLLYEADVKIIRKRIVDEIYSEKLKSKEDIKLRIEELLNEGSFYKNNLLIYISSIKCNDEKRISLVECNKIKDELRSEVNLDKLHTIEQVNSKFNELVKQKVSDSYVLINYFYSIMGRREIKYSFFNEFLTYNLDNADIKEIRERILEEIKSFKLKSKEIINLRINELINQKKKIKYRELLIESNSIVGEKDLSDSFLKRLSDNGLTANVGIYIKSVLEDKIKNYSIKNKLEITEEINNLINDELIRQNKSITKLNELFQNDNIYLRGFSSSEREEIKDIVIKSIKDNRLNYFSVYQEFKKVIDEFEKTKNIDDSNESKNEDSNEANEANEDNEDNENKSSNGFISKLKRFFSFK